MTANHTDFHHGKSFALINVFSFDMPLSLVFFNQQFARNNLTLRLIFALKVIAPQSSRYSFISEQASMQSSTEYAINPTGLSRYRCAEQLENCLGNS